MYMHKTITFVIRTFHQCLFPTQPTIHLPHPHMAQSVNDNSPKNLTFGDHALFGMIYKINIIAISIPEVPSSR